MTAPQTAPNNLAPGTILAGKYRVTRILGQGGMGVVVEAQHIQLEDRVALKFLLPEYASHPEASERFLREARAAVKIKSEHVARVSDVGTLDTGSPYMVMEYLQGDDLSNTLEKLGPLNLQDAVDYIIQGCEAINEAHGYGIVHRDIKPANLFVTKRPDGSPLVKVLDFGISKTMGAGVDGLTRTTATMGSALYMSPEQMRQSKGVDHRTDIYSLGITLYELLAGKQPFYANTLPELCAEVLTGSPTPLLQVRNDVPAAFAVVLERGYARERDHRYQTVTEFVFALAPFAPARSQAVIDRFARLGQLTAPRAGEPPPAGLTTQIAPGGYGSVPHSSRSAAVFASNPSLGSTGNNVHGTTSAELYTTAPKPPKSNGGVIAAMLAAFVLLGGGVGGWYYMKTKSVAAAGNDPTIPVPGEVAETEEVTGDAPPPSSDTPVASAAPEATSASPTGSDAPAVDKPEIGVNTTSKPNTKTGTPRTTPSTKATASAKATATAVVAPQPTTKATGNNGSVYR